MSSSWFFVKDGQRNGPVRREELDARIAEGVVDGGTLVWRPGMAAWEQACAVGELGLPPPLPPPPLPPPAMAPAPAEAPEDVVVAARPEPASVAEAPRFRASYAGFRVRLAAKLIDGVILYGLGVMVAQAVVAFAFDGVMPTLSDPPSVLRFAAYVLPARLCVGLVYHVYFLAKHEATPGKRVLGLRVVRPDGGRLGAGRMVGRFFSELLSRATFLAGYVMAAFDEEKRTLHDYLCDTRVVRGPREDGR